MPRPVSQSWLHDRFTQSFTKTQTLDLYTKLTKSMTDNVYIFQKLHKWFWCLPKTENLNSAVRSPTRVQLHNSKQSSWCWLDKVGQREEVYAFADSIKKDSILKNGSVVNSSQSILEAGLRAKWQAYQPLAPRSGCYSAILFGVMSPSPKDWRLVQLNCTCYMAS